MNIALYGLLLIQMCGMIGGQLLTKEGVTRLGEISVQTIPAAIASPWLWGGAITYVAASVLWLWLLSKGDFTVLVPLQSLSMVITVIMGAFLFHEDVNMVRWIGVVVMAVGAVMVAR